MRKNNLYILNELKNKNRGSTLLEVIVSVFLLTFGILALMAAQLRSVSSVSEAENHCCSSRRISNGRYAGKSERPRKKRREID